MAQQLICDICGRPIKDPEDRFFRIKELKHGRVYDELVTRWVNIDAHNSCVKTLLSAQERRTQPPTGGSAMQDE